MTTHEAEAIIERMAEKGYEQFTCEGCGRVLWIHRDDLPLFLSGLCADCDPETPDFWDA